MGIGSVGMHASAIRHGADQLTSPSSHYIGNRALAPELCFGAMSDTAVHQVGENAHEHHRQDGLFARCA